MSNYKWTRIWCDCGFPWCWTKSTHPSCADYRSPGEFTVGLVLGSKRPHCNAVSGRSLGDNDRPVCEVGLDDMAKIYITVYFLISVDTIYFRYRYEHLKTLKTLKKKSLIKTAKNAHNRCLYLKTYEKWTCQVYELLLLNYIILGGEKQHK